jgi:hypothetical protein
LEVCSPGKEGEMVVKGEGLLRLEAERRLLKTYKAEFERSARRRGRVAAVRGLVTAHKDRYNAFLREIREDPQIGRRMA